MKFKWRATVRQLQCTFGKHAWSRTTGSIEYRSGYNTRACEHCPASEIYASELGRWIENKL